MESLECDICMEPYNLLDRRPKVLPCGHSACSGCLQNLPSKCCPNCRKDFPALEDLPDNYIVLHLIEAAKQRFEMQWCTNCECVAVAGDHCFAFHRVVRVSRGEKRQFIVERMKELERKIELLDRKKELERKVELERKKELDRKEELERKEDSLRSSLQQLREQLQSVTEELERKEDSLQSSLQQLREQLQSATINCRSERALTNPGASVNGLQQRPPTPGTERRNAATQLGTEEGPGSSAAPVEEPQRPRLLVTPPAFFWTERRNGATQSGLQDHPGSSSALVEERQRRQLLVTPPASVGTERRNGATQLGTEEDPGSSAASGEEPQCRRLFVTPPASVVTEQRNAATQLVTQEDPGSSAAPVEEPQGRRLLVTPPASVGTDQRIAATQLVTQEDPGSSTAPVEEPQGRRLLVTPPASVGTDQRNAATQLATQYPIAEPVEEAQPRLSVTRSQTATTSALVVEAVVEYLDVGRLSDTLPNMCTDEKAQLLEVVARRGVLRLANVYCDRDQDWTVALLNAAAPHLEELQLLRVPTEYEGRLHVHLMAVERMPKLHRLKVSARLEDNVEDHHNHVFRPLPDSHCGLKFLQVWDLPCDTLKGMLEVHSRTLVELHLLLGTRGFKRWPLSGQRFAQCLVFIRMEALRRMVLWRTFACSHSAEACHTQIRDIRSILHEDCQVHCSGCDQVVPWGN